MGADTRVLWSTCWSSVPVRAWGNQEVIRPFAARGDVELLLVTPQMQSFEAGAKSEGGAVHSARRMFRTGTTNSLSGNRRMWSLGGQRYPISENRHADAGG
ncbi:MAG: hypothetical protein Ct9H300mP30_1060 [Methanobacteriota archaeon]|nr:MAG: hypothetical protein Ct9H300mP30_1060 [Euryarchaeota archaeon]